MPKFTVRFRQMVEEIAHLEIEADTAEEAFAKAEQHEDYMNGELDWSDGSEVRDDGIVGIFNDQGLALVLKGGA